MKTIKDLKHLKSLREAKEKLETGDALNLDMEGLIEGYTHGNRAKTIGTDIEKGYKALIERRLPSESAGEQTALDLGEVSISSEIVEDTELMIDITTGEMFKIAEKLGVADKYEKRTRGKDLFLKAYAAGKLESELADHIKEVKQNKFLVTRKKQSTIKLKEEE